MKTYDIAFLGAKGGGKTLGMSAFSLIFAKQQGLNLFSNYRLQDSEFVKTIQRMKEIENGIFCFTEVHKNFDSRFSKEKVNTFLTHWYLETRKRNLNFFYDTQDFAQVDKRIRQNTRYLVFCTEKSTYFKYLWLDNDTGENIANISISKSIFDFNIYDTSEISSYLQ